MAFEKIKNLFKKEPRELSPEKSMGGSETSGLMMGAGASVAMSGLTGIVVGAITLNNSGQQAIGMPSVWGGLGSVGAGGVTMVIGKEIQETNKDIGCARRAPEQDKAFSQRQNEKKQKLGIEKENTPALPLKLTRETKKTNENGLLNYKC